MKSNVGDSIFSRNYASKSNPLNIKMLVRKRSFTRNSHSRLF